MSHAGTVRAARSTGDRALPRRYAGVKDMAAWARSQLGIEQVVVVRTSDKSKAGFEAMFKAGVAMLPDDPDVQDLAALGPKIVTDDGAADRERLGAYEIRRGSVPGGVGYALLGYAFRIGRTLFVLYLETARCADIPGPTPDQTRNAFTEALIMLLRDLRPRVCFTPMISRVFRNTAFAGQLLRTLQSLRIRLVAGGEEVALTGAEGQLTALLKAWFSAQEADGVVSRLGDVELGMYLEGAWYLGQDVLPFTWRVPARVELNALTGEPIRVVDDKHQIEAVPAAALVLREFLDGAALSTRTRHELGTALGRAGVISRAPRHAGKNVRLDSRPHSNLAASAARTLLQERWLDAWQHGTYRRVIRLKSDPSKTMPALRDRLVDIDGQLCIEIETPMPAPEGGWGISDATFEAVRERLRADAERTASTRASRSGQQKPLNGLADWIDADRQHWALTSIQHGSAYELRTRPAAQSDDRASRAAAWTIKDRWVATIDPAALHQSVGSAMVAAVAGLEDQTVPLSLSQPPAEHPRDRAAEDLEQARTALCNAEARIKALKDERRALSGRAHGTLTADEQELLDELPADEAEARQARREAAALVETLSAAASAALRVVDVPPDETASADVGTVELLAAALIRTDYRAPDSLNRLLHRVLRDLRVQQVAHGTAVTWTATLVVPLTDNREASLELSSAAPIPSRRRTSTRSKQPTETAQNPASLARLYLDDALSMPEIGRLRAIRGDGSHDSTLFRHVAGALTGLGVAPGLVNAAIDMPAVLRPELYRAFTLPEHQLDPWQRHLRATYTSHDRFGPTWDTTTRPAALSPGSRTTPPTRSRAHRPMNSRLGRACRTCGSWSSQVPGCRSSTAREGSAGVPSCVATGAPARAGSLPFTSAPTLTVAPARQPDAVTCSSRSRRLRPRPPSAATPNHFSGSPAAPATRCQAYRISSFPASTSSAGSAVAVRPSRSTAPSRSSEPTSTPLRADLRPNSRRHARRRPDHHTHRTGLAHLRGTRALGRHRLRRPRSRPDARNRGPPHAPRARTNPGQSRRPARLIDHCGASAAAPTR